MLWNLNHSRMILRSLKIVLMKKYQLSDYHQKALNDYGLDDTWPDGVLINAKKIEDQFLDDKHRLEDFPFVTIDGEDAKDFDDAIFALRMMMAFISK